MFGTDLWQIGIAHGNPAELLLGRGLDTVEISWLPTSMPWSYLADPFGLWRDGALHVFAEAFDYRTRHGVIDVLRLSAEFEVLDRRTCLAEPWHLSYPFVFEARGEVYLLPEAHRSGTLTLYRASAFPERWEAVALLPLDAPAVDPTLFRHEGRWWLAYAPGTNIAARQGHLHLAWATNLTGPWHPHPLNPVRTDRRGARPGGRVFENDGRLYLPVQDCSTTYGGALRPLEITLLDPVRFAANLGSASRPNSAFGSHRHGCHTLAGCGPVTLIDGKRIIRSPRAWPIHLRGILHRMIAART